MCNFKSEQLRQLISRYFKALQAAVAASCHRLVSAWGLSCGSDTVDKAHARRQTVVRNLDEYSYLVN